jgi:cation diffusion facilitator CzcD-associated flavoprotein CzcO
MRQPISGGQTGGHASRNDPQDLLIIGAGFSGCTCLSRARSMGLRALAIAAAPSVGVTWYHNRSPALVLTPKA